MSPMTKYLRRIRSLVGEYLSDKDNWYNELSIFTTRILEIVPASESALAMLNSSLICRARWIPRQSSPKYSEYNGASLSCSMIIPTECSELPYQAKSRLAEFIHEIYYNLVFSKKAIEINDDTMRPEYFYLDGLMVLLDTNDASYPMIYYNIGTRAIYDMFSAYDQGIIVDCQIFLTDKDMLNGTDK